MAEGACVWASRWSAVGGPAPNAGCRMTWPAPDTLDAATLTVAAVIVAHRGNPHHQALAKRLLDAAKTAPEPKETKP